MGILGGNKQPPNPQDVATLRSQGLTDSLIMEEMTRQGHAPEHVHAAISALDQQSGDEFSGASMAQDFGMPSQPASMSQQPSMQHQMPTRDLHHAAGDAQDMLTRVEEIVENMVDERWDQLIGQVKRIVEWKDHIEERQRAMQNDLMKLKEDFATLHQGVLGKLEDYDTRMQKVGTELNAVGKVFKDVVPVFVENVKELRHINEGMKKK